MARSASPDFSAQTWPDAPVASRPCVLPHALALSPDDSALLMAKGWQPVDVRLLANKTIEERREAVNLTLAAMRIGTIEVSTPKLRAIELEARVLGLLKGDAKEPEEKKADDVIMALKAFQFRSKG